VRALVVCNQGEADAGYVGERFEQHGFEFNRLSREHPGEWPTLDGVDLLVHLGSEWSVYWQEVQREVSAESAMMAEAHRRGVPVFAICFGAQMLAKTLGGDVARSKKPEIGWHDVLATANNAVVGGRWMQWHHDVFSVPVDAATLALSEVGPQAFVSRRSLGTQFHPEANEAIVTDWLAGDGVLDLVASNITPNDLLEETRREVTRSAGAAHHLVDWFLTSVASAPLPKKNAQK
jgi:GMP synthase-like glutamine amidotransferase